MSVQRLPLLPLPQERRDGWVKLGRIRPEGSKSIWSEIWNLLRAPVPRCPLPPSPAGFLRPLAGACPGPDVRPSL